MEIVNEINTQPDAPSSGPEKQRSLIIQPWIIRIVLGILVSFIIGLLYYRARVTYHHLETSYEELESTYQKQAQLVQELQLKMERLEELNQAKEETIQSLEQENAKLRKQLKLLDSLKELEDNLTRLKRKNRELVAALEEAKMAGPPPQKAVKGFLVPEPQDLTTSEQATRILRILKQKVMAIEEQKKHLQRKEETDHDAVAAATAVHTTEVPAGNQGFLIRNGRSTYLITVSKEPVSSPRPKIRVEFMD